MGRLKSNYSPASAQARPFPSSERGPALPGPGLSRFVVEIGGGSILPSPYTIPLLV
jgi:hypothetical protein